MSKLVIIDAHSVLHRAYHALPPLTTKKGEPINAVYGFVSMLLRTIQDLKPTHLIIAFDRKEPTFRKKVFADYQAHRPETDKDLSVQFAKAREVVSAFGIPIYDKAGYEADDVIGTVVKKAEKKINHVVIVTGDRDILQLVSKQTKVYLPIRGLSEAILMGEEEVFEKLGVKPSQVDEYKALVGDPSDNYKGVPGIGPVTAVELLSQYKDLDDIYKNIGKIDERVAKKLKNGKKSAKMSQKLAVIVTNVPIKIDFQKAAKWRVDDKKVFDLFAEYGFATLTKRVRKVGEQIQKEKQGSLF